MKKIETVEDYCQHKDCVYRGYLNGSRRIPTCDFILLKGERRNADISKCNRYRKGKRRIVSHMDFIDIGIELDEDDYI